jgi:phosphoglycolate phosphatase-like HAD superfamily hydrolase
MSGPIAVFDIDGTLTDTNRVDHECYVVAVREVLGWQVGDDWGGVEDVTDSNILRELWRRQYKEVIPDHVEQAVIALFVDLLQVEARRYPDRFRPIPGARDVFTRLAEIGWSSAMATGGWRPSAELKLWTASVPFEGVPLASASDRILRTDIIRHALGSMEEQGATAVYVGDRPWDVRAAQALGMGFLGVGRGTAADELQKAGAGVMIEDLRDTGLLERSLQAAIDAAPGARQS